jgi:hypothetical protein
VFAIISILIELELTTAARESNLCQSWEYRGFGYIFLGLLHASTAMTTKCQGAEDRDEEEEEENTVAVESSLTFQLLTKFISLSLMIIGVLYILLGLLNMKRVRDEKMARYVQLISYLEVRSSLSHS